MTASDCISPPAWENLGGGNIWLPYTQMKTAPVPLVVSATEGATIILKDGRRLVDGIASWWTACHGYNHPAIHAAVAAQLATMPHIMFGGLNHEPALRLAQRLCALWNKNAPGHFSRVFFSESGSVAVEIALKIAVQYWQSLGQPQRTKFLSFHDGYHGDTMATMALCDPIEGMHQRFAGYLPTQFHAALPRDTTSTAALHHLLEQHQHDIAAIIIEPLVQGAGGMKFHDPATLRRIAAAAHEFDTLLIADEIMTGFGRTGAIFASHEAGIEPDLCCLAKALTGGTLPLAATLATNRIFQQFWSDDAAAALMHGPTFMANALACAAANASLDLFETEPRLAEVAALEEKLTRGLAPCVGLPGVKEVRVKGAIGVVELTHEAPRAWFNPRFIARGVWLRPFGNIVYTTPAFTITDSELAQLIAAITATVAEWSNQI